MLAHFSFLRLQLFAFTSHLEDHQLIYIRSRFVGVTGFQTEVVPGTMFASFVALSSV